MVAAPVLPLLLSGLLFSLLGIPLILGIVPPNRLYGFRVPATLANRDLWYIVNRAAGIDLVTGGVLLVAIGFSLPAIGRYVPVLRSNFAAPAMVLLVAAGMTMHGLWLTYTRRAA